MAMTISAMEYLLDFNFSLILPFFTAALFLLFAGYFKSKSSSKTNLPPGSFGWPIIGETLAFVNQDHEKFIGERMKKYSSKIFKTNIFGEKAVVLCGAAGHKFLSSNEEKLFLVWRPQSMQKLFRSSNQKAYTRSEEKQIIGAPGFLRVDALVRYLPAMDSMVQEHFNRYWVGKQNVEAHHLSQLLVLTLSGRFFWGLEDKARIKKLCKLMDTMMLALHVIDLDIPGTIFYRAMKAAKLARKEIQLLVKEKREAMANGVKMADILSFMIAHPDPATGKIMEDHDIANKTLGLVSAAFNSPAMTTAFIVKYLGERPEVYDKIRKEQIEIASSKKDGEPLNSEDMQKMKCSWSVALEVMRLIPPLTGTFREAATDINYEGYTIPKGWKIYWTVNTTNKNREFFPAPEEFDASRFEKEAPPPYTNIPFGSGPRICPGKDYAKLQILTFMHHLVKRFKWDVINPNCKVLGGLNPVPTEGIYVRLHPCPP